MTDDTEAHIKAVTGPFHVPTPAPRDRLAGFRIREGDPAAKMPAFDVTGAIAQPPATGLREELADVGLSEELADEAVEFEPVDDNETT